MAQINMTINSHRTKRYDYAWRASGNYWQQAQLITAGIDVGSTTTQATVIADNDIIAYSTAWNEADEPDNSRKVLGTALKGTGLTEQDIHYMVGTGCGGISIPDINRTVSEIVCHARGASYAVGPALRTVLTMGGRECIAISCKETGAVSEFLANACRPAECRENQCNACGAAQGMGIEYVADVLDVPIDKVGALSLGVNEVDLAERLTLPHDNRENIDDELLEEIAEEILAQGGTSPLSGVLGVVCAVLAQTQARGLLRNGWSKPEILAAYCAALAHQAALLVKRLGVKEKLAVTGGVAKNIGVVKRLERELGIKTIIAGPDPQITAALGAALYARDFARNSRTH